MKNNLKPIPKRKTNHQTSKQEEIQSDQLLKNPFKVSKIRTTMHMGKLNQKFPLSSRSQAATKQLYSELLIQQKLRGPQKNNEDTPGKKIYFDYADIVKKQIQIKVHHDLTPQKAQSQDSSCQKQAKQDIQCNSQFTQYRSFQKKHKSVQKFTHQKAQQEAYQLAKAYIEEKMAEIQLQNEQDNIVRPAQMYALNHSKMISQKSSFLPPFSFTNTKWRSKSQLFQIDKWKQKYGYLKNIGSVKHLKHIQSDQIDPIKKSINKLQKLKGKIQLRNNQDLRQLIQLNAQNSESLASKLNKIKLKPFFNSRHFQQLQTNKSQQLKKVKIDNRQTIYGLSKQNENNQISLNEMISYQTSNQILYKGQEIVIKKMYKDSATQNQEKQDILTPVDQDSKQSKDLSPTKSPKKYTNGLDLQISISKLNLLKDEQTSPKKLKIDYLSKPKDQKIIKQPPKRLQLLEILQQGPQRWQMAASRQANVQQQTDVGSYLRLQRIKQEQQILKKKDRLNSILQNFDEENQQKQKVQNSSPVLETQQQLLMPFRYES